VVVKFSEITSRLTGVSCPVFGLQWQPPISDVGVARSVIVFLEDRRLLYDPSEIEVPEHCIQSAIQIRQYLTDLLVRGGVNKDLEDHLRAIRTACRWFISTIGDPEDEHGLVAAMTDRRYDGYNGLSDYRLNQTLGALRATTGMHVAILAVKYGLDVDSPLDTILPPAE